MYIQVTLAVFGTPYLQKVLNMETHDCQTHDYCFLNIELMVISFVNSRF